MGEKSARELKVTRRKTNAPLKIRLHGHQYGPEMSQRGRGETGGTVGRRRRTKQFFLRLAVCNVIYYVANRAIKVNSAVLSPYSLPPLPPPPRTRDLLAVPVAVSCSGQLLRGIHRANCLAPFDAPSSAVTSAVR